MFSYSITLHVHHNVKFICLEIQLDAATTLNRQKDEEIAKLKSLLQDREDEIEEQNGKIRSHETERRKLHNQIQELKVNIRQV